MKTSKQTKSEKSYSLIEMLVVVVIIGVLSMIVSHQVLSAKIRANVTRVIGDFKAVAAALEMYYCDNLEYPNKQFLDIFVYGCYFNELSQLTIPISYIQTMPQSPWDGKRSLVNYLIQNPNLIHPQKNIIVPFDYFYLNCDWGSNSGNDGYWLESSGPSGFTTGRYYHPSNGLMSEGRIVVSSSKMPKF